MELLAVYGTLKRGQYNHAVIEQDASYVGVASLPGWRMYSLGAFPVIVPAEPDQAVFVEIFAVSDLVATDRLEGFPSFYNRKKVETHVGDAWVYYMESVGHRGAEQITSGVW